MSESNPIPLPPEEDESADADVSIDLDTLSDDQLDALPDEIIHRLPETARQKIACRYFVESELLPSGEGKTYEWIARRVGISVRQFHRWRKADFWAPLLAAEKHRAYSYVGDIPLLHLRPRMQALAKAYKQAEKASDRQKILKEFDRIAEKLGITAVDLETQDALDQVRAKVSKVLSYVSKNPTSHDPS